MTEPEIHAMIEAQRELNERFVAEYQRLMDIGNSLGEFHNEISVQLSYCMNIVEWLMQIMEHHGLDYSDALSKRIPSIDSIHDLLCKIRQEMLPPI